MKINVCALLLIASCFLMAAGCSKHKNREDVPEEVIVKFDEDQKEADDVYWEPAEDGFQATFTSDGIEKVAIYTPAGKVKRLEFVVEEEEVPVVVVTNLKKKYPKAQIEHITYMEVPGRKPYYVLRTRDDRAVSNIEINFKGFFVKRKVLENLVLVSNSHDNDHDDHEECHGHHKHKNKHKHKGKHGHGHGNCKDHHEEKQATGIVIKF